MAQWRWKLWNLDIQSQFSMSKKRSNLSKKNSMKDINLGPHVLHFLAPKLFLQMTSNFWPHFAISVLKISKNNFATFLFFVKMNFVPTVWVSMWLSKSCYYYCLRGHLATDPPALLMFTALTKVDKGMTQPQLDSAFIFFVTHYLCTLDKKDTKSTTVNRLSKFDKCVMYLILNC